MYAFSSRGMEIWSTLDTLEQRYRAEYVAEMKRMYRETKHLMPSTVEYHRNRLLTQVKTRLATIKDLRELFGVNKYPPLED
jgi:hypothetical protein